MCKLGVISQERLTIEVKLLLSANRESYMPRRLAQQRMTLSDLEWPFHASRVVSTVGELLVYGVASGRLNWLLVRFPVHVNPFTTDPVKALHFAILV